MLNKPRLTSLCYIFLLVFSFTSSYVKAASDGLSAYLCDHPALNEHPGIRDLSLLKSKLEVYRENGYLALATSTLSTLGNYARRNGMLKGPIEKKQWNAIAEKYLLEAVDCSRALLKRNSIGDECWKSFFDLAYLYQQQKRFNEAEKSCKEGVTVLRQRARNAFQLMHGLEFHARQLEALGKFNAAEKNILEAREIYKIVEGYWRTRQLKLIGRDETYIIRMRRELRAARLYSHWGKEEKTVSHYIKALEQATKGGSDYLACRCMFYLGNYYLKTNESPKAIQTYNSALMLIEKSRYVEYKKYAFLQLTNFYKKAGNLSMEKKYETKLKSLSGLNRTIFNRLLALVDVHGYCTYYRYLAY